MSDFQKLNKTIEDAVVGGYQKIETAAVDGYQKVEQAAVSGYRKVENRFVGAFLTREGESVAEAKARLAREQERPRQEKH